MIVLFSLLLASCGGSRLDEGVPKHVVVVSIDTARADRFGFMGATDASTPRLDALASESIVFTDYMTVVPTTLVSHTSLFTGKYPHHHGTPRNGFMVNRENEMLAETLSELGFHTAGFAGSFALDERFDFAQGFDHYDQDFDVLVGESAVDQNQRLAEDVTDAALRYLDDRGVPDRLFLFVHYFDPHQPYGAPPPFDTLHDPAGRSDLVPMHALAGSSSADIEAEARRHELQYASEISYTDEHIGRLLDGLRARGVLKDAVVVVTSDHGENMWEHGEEFDHGRTIFQATMHALCLFRLPGGLSGGQRSSWPMTNVDVLPTILSLLGAEPPDGIDGTTIDLTALAHDPPGRARFGQATKPWRGVETDRRWVNMLKSRCIRQGPYKYIETPFLGEEELYDVAADPFETVNLLEVASTEHESVAARLRPILGEWAESADPLPSWFESSQQEETMERLRSLGYLR